VSTPKQQLPGYWTFLVDLRKLGGVLSECLVKTLDALQEFDHSSFDNEPLKNRMDSIRLEMEALQDVNEELKMLQKRCDILQSRLVRATPIVVTS
jgi:hypothetical protein